VSLVELHDDQLPEPITDIRIGKHGGWAHAVTFGARGFLGAFGSAPICAAYVLAV
jgi:hypothetical protein